MLRIDRAGDCVVPNPSAGTGSMVELLAFRRDLGADAIFNDELNSNRLAVGEADSIGFPDGDTSNDGLNDD